MLHEVAHLLFNAGGVCDALPRRRPLGPTDELEVLCNRVAAAALMPAAAFRNEAAVRAGAPDGRWSEQVISGLADRYSVSREAVVRAITGSDLSEFLEIKVNQVPKLEAELAATGGSRD